MLSPHTFVCFPHVQPKAIVPREQIPNISMEKNMLSVLLLLIKKIKKKGEKSAVFKDIL